MNFVLHAGVRPRDMYGRDNPHDLSSFVPAQVIGGNVNAVWTTAGSDVMDDAVTITSAVMRFTVHQVNGDHGDLMAEMQSQGVVLPPGATGMVPAWEAVVNAHTATATAYSSEIDVPVGKWLARILYACQDATADRSLRASDEVTGVALKYPKDTKTPFQVFLDYLAGHAEYGTHETANSGAAESGGTEKMGADFNGVAPKGLWGIDLRSFGEGPLSREYGYDLTGFNNGDWKLGRTITTYAAGDDSLILYELRKVIRNKLSS